MENKPLKTIVCGTTFGRIYLEGIKLLPDKFELVGILARGSNNSVLQAKKYSVPLYTDIDDLPFEDIDLACVVIRSSIVSGPGSKIAEKLLLKGVSVIQEQPVHHDDIAGCLRIAKKKRVFFHVNSFYPDVLPVNNFIKAANRILKKSRPIYLDGACSVHVLFPFMDIIGKTLGRLSPWDFKSHGSLESKSPLSFLTGDIKGIPVTLRVQNQINPKDPDNDTLLLHRLELCTDKGTLLLTDTHGSVIWVPHMSVSRNDEGLLNIYGVDEDLSFLVSEPAGNIKSISMEDVFLKVWPESIKQFLHGIYSKIIMEKKDVSSSQYLLSLAKIWQDIGKELGLPEVIDSYHLNPMPLDKF